MERQEIQKIQPAGKKSSYGAVMWGVLPACILFAGSIAAYLETCREQAPGYLYPVLMGAFGLTCMAAGEILGRKRKVFHLFGLLPWIVVLVLSGGSCLTGQLLWVNVLITRWNQIHEAGLTLFAVSETSEGLLGAAMLMAVLISELAWGLVYKRLRIALCTHSVFWIFLMLLEETFFPVACACLLAGLLGSVMAGGYRETSVRVRVWMLTAAAVLCICAFILPQGELTGISTTRKEAAHQIHELRYGKDTLPEGDLYKAGTLREDDAAVMQVQSEQAKTLYLKGFAGGVLEDGVWKPLPDSAYGNEDAGILKWLAEQDFDPLTQSAQYYALGDEADKPEENSLLYQMEQGSRYYMYAPSSLEQVVTRNAKEKKDQNLLGRGLYGQREYQLLEVSGSRPGELTIVADWVLNPRTEEQQKYVEAEAVYRDFVYRHYTAVDDSLGGLIQKWFWEDYETKSDGIYSAVTHIRQKLTEGVSYTDKLQAVPEGENPLQYFLTGSREGNAVLYASAAVEAFRSHGIPARYVEGYYVSTSELEAAKDGKVAVTGKEAHAWAEVYFDGIGWLPVDVTPGYYYDAMKLQQMIGMPDAVHKTAALENREFSADEINDMEGGSSREPQAQGLEIPDPAVMILGIAAIVLILLTIVFCIAELLRSARLWRIEHAVNRTDPSRRAAKIEELLYGILALLKIDASLGWATEQTDQELAKRFEKIEPGEYKRASQLIEKAVYGDVVLEPFEERTLFSFLDKLAVAGNESGWKTRLRIRYLLLK